MKPVATCCLPSSNPCDWDAQTARPKAIGEETRIRSLVAEQLRAEQLCAECPLLAQCAHDALHTSWTGVIIAGVPFLTNSTVADKKAAHEALTLVADGAPLWAAHGTQLASSTHGATLAMVGA